MGYWGTAGDALRRLFAIDVRASLKTVLPILVNLLDYYLWQQKATHAKVVKAVNTAFVSCNLPALLRKEEKATNLSYSSVTSTLLLLIINKKKKGAFLFNLLCSVFFF
jgi:hypothetical protein